MQSISGKWYLDDLAILQIEGPDAAGFLHAQLSNTVINMAPKQAVPAAYCNAQGRLLANGIVICMAVNKFYFVLAKDLANNILKRLSLFLLRSKAKISLLTDTYVYGLAGNEHMPAQLSNSNPWQCYSNSTDTWVQAPSISSKSCWLISTEQADIANNSDKSLWYADRISSGWPLIRLNNQEKFLPAALNMDLNGFIDFDKGCYPGQEVIARSYYRGNSKRRLAAGIAKLDNTHNISINTSLLTDLYSSANPNDKPVGRIIEAAITANKLYVSAEINMSDWPSTEYLAGPNGPALTMRLFTNTGVA